jgi:spermidine synthase
MPAFALTIFLGAFLLFQVQPLIGKYLLPWFGGGPGVWTTCLLFFQSALVGGYAYAHVLARYFKPRTQTVIHLALLATAIASLPIVPSEAWKTRVGHPVVAIMLLLAANIGLPFLVLAATGPLLQSWSAHSGKPPYRLYALSNLGSLLALASYPVFFEAHFTRRTQARFWEYLFVLYAFACGFCTVYSLSGCRVAKDCPDAELAPASKRVQEASAPALGRRLLWVLWPACGSVLLLATTNKLCLDVAVVPLLWVLPLGVYLLSFVICFSGPSWYPRLTYTLALGAGMVGLCWALFQGGTWPFWKQVSVYTGALFVCCMVCHGELFRIRPERHALTEFYLMVAIGGALGGVFVSLIAPALFTNYYELHLGLAMLGLLVLGVRTCEIIRTLIPTTFGQPGASTTSASSWRAREFTRLGLALLWLFFFGLITVLWLQARRFRTDIVHKSRNFYGVLTVFEYRKDETNGHHFLLRHGRITHGFQFVNPQLQNWPTTYYGHDSGLGLAFAALPTASRRVGVVGLGTGTIAAYSRPEDFFHFYEVNPQVCRLATTRFNFLANCRGRTEVTVGDARLSLERQQPQSFDLLVLDAFNSDSIPVHLLTIEAFQTYLRHLEPQGVIAVHISNHFLNLEPLVAAMARELGLNSVLIDHDANPKQWWIYSSTWVLLSRQGEILDSPSIRAAAKSVGTLKKHPPLWTDDFSNLFQILRSGTMQKGNHG